jgi:hypothetical protein
MADVRAQVAESPARWGIPDGASPIAVRGILLRLAKSMVVTELREISESRATRSPPSWTPEAGTGVAAEIGSHRHQLAVDAPGLGPVLAHGRGEAGGIRGRLRCGRLTITLGLAELPTLVTCHTPLPH